MQAVDVDLLSKEDIDWLNAYHAEVYGKLSPSLDENERAFLKEKTKTITPYIVTYGNTGNQKEIPVKRFILYGVLGLILALLQVTAVDLISIGSAVPDLVLLLIIWIGVQEGYMEGILFGFALGLLFDLATFDIVGTNALAKCTAGLFAGFFHKKDAEKQLVTKMNFLPVIFAISLIHNLIYGIFQVNANQWSFFRYFAEYSVASALYSTAFGIFAYAIGSRDNRRPGS
jgi:rod shape-determining protein MreD